MKKTIVIDGNRAKGSGTLVLRGTTWHARWMVKGKLFTRSTKCSDREEAEKKLAEFVKPFQEETTLEVLENLSAKMRVQEQRIEEVKKDAVIKEQKKIRIDSLVDVYMSDVATGKISEGTENSYFSKAKALKNFTGKTYVCDVTLDDATHFLEDLKTKTCPTAFNCTLVFLRTSFKMAMKKDMRIKSNVWEGFTKLKADKSHSRRELSNEEIEKLISVAESSTRIKHNFEIALLFKVGIFTGLRKSDCCSLKWSEVDFSTNMIRKLPKKTKRTGALATIPIHPRLREILLTLKRDSEYVNPFAYEAYNDRKLDGYVSAVFDEAGIKTCEKDESGKIKLVAGFHSLRTTFVSNCARGGIPLNVIQKMVAHSRIDMTMHYTRTTEEDLRLPDFEDVKVSLKKSTFKLLESKLKKNQSVDELICELLTAQS